MTEENNATPQVPAEPAVPETPATPAPEATPAAESVEKKPVPKNKITVTSAPKEHRPGSFNPNDRAAKKQWIAQKNKEHQDMLIAAGYSATATIAIMRYLSQNHGYEAARSKDHLILMFEGFAKSLKYRMPMFDIQVSSQMIVLLISVCENLTRNRELFKMDPKESSKYVSKVVDAAWKHGAKDNTNPQVDMQRLKQFFLRAINPSIPEGYAQRAQYFIECIIDVAMKTMIDPFEGLFHTEEIEMPEEMKKKQKKFQHPDVMCPKCNEKMQWVYPLKKHVCVNPLCEDFRPPRHKGSDFKKGEGGPKKYSKAHTGGYDSGKPIQQQSASDKFKQKYAMKPRQPRIIASTGPTKTIKDKDGIEMTVRKNFQEDSNPFAALDALKVKTEPTPSPTETVTVSTENLPPPPAEQPVV